MQAYSEEEENGKKEENGKAFKEENGKACKGFKVSTSEPEALNEQTAPSLNHEGLSWIFLD